jgi:hypothetical protein
MKFLSIAVLSAGIFSQANAAEPAAAQVPSTMLSKTEITAILDIKTKQNIDTTKVVITPFVAPVSYELLARENTRTRNRFASPKTLGDE